MAASVVVTGQEPEATRQANHITVAAMDERLLRATAGSEATGCFFAESVSRLGSVEDTIESVNNCCVSEDFKWYLSRVGLKNPTFHRNVNLLTGAPCLEKFVQGWSSLRDMDIVGIAFHGTPKANVASILKEGLDPKRRKGQAYGPGEYFSKEPGVSVGFCKGSLEMLVFAVVVSNSTRRATCPPDYVVVGNNNHQLPIGTIKYSAVDMKVLKQSQNRRKRFIDMRRKLNQQTRQAKEMLIKATIIQHLMAKNNVDASDLYQRNGKILSALSKREITMYVYRFVDNDKDFSLFPDIPKPMKVCDCDAIKIIADKIAQEAIDLSRKIQVEEAALHKRPAPDIGRQQGSKDALKGPGSTPKAPKFAEELREKVRQASKRQGAGPGKGIRAKTSDHVAQVKDDSNQKNVESRSEHNSPTNKTDPVVLLVPEDKLKKFLQRV